MYDVTYMYDTAGRGGEEGGGRRGGGEERKRGKSHPIINHNSSD